MKLKPEVEQFKTQVKMFMPPWTWKHQEKELLYFSMGFFDKEYYFKNGKLRKFDITNTQKAVQDAVCEKIGIDDSYVKSSHLFHRPCQLKTYMEINIGVYEEDATTN